VISALTGREVTVEAPGRLLVPGCASSDVLQILYSAGVRVDSVAPAEGLEELFLSLTGGESGDAPAAG